MESGKKRKKKAGSPILRSATVAPRKQNDLAKYITSSINAVHDPNTSARSARIKKPFLETATITQPKGLLKQTTRSQSPAKMFRKLENFEKLRDNLIGNHLQKMQDYVKLQSELQEIRNEYSKHGPISFKLLQFLEKMNKKITEL